MFCIDTMIWTCKCCGHTVTISCMTSSTKTFRCPICDHANTMVDSFTTAEMEKVLEEKRKEAEKDLEKKHKAR